jgi:hypothetical protein
MHACTLQEEYDLESISIMASSRAAVQDGAWVPGWLARVMRGRSWVGLTREQALRIVEACAMLTEAPAAEVVDLDLLDGILTAVLPTLGSWSAQEVQRLCDALGKLKHGLATRGLDLLQKAHAACAHGSQEGGDAIGGPVFIIARMLLKGGKKGEDGVGTLKAISSLLRIAALHSTSDRHRPPLLSVEVGRALLEKAARLVKAGITCSFLL